MSVQVNSETVGGPADCQTDQGIGPRTVSIGEYPVRRQHIFPGLSMGPILGPRGATFMSVPDADVTSLLLTGIAGYGHFLSNAMSSLASGHCNDQSQYCESLASARLFSFWRRESKQWGQGPLRHTTATVARSVHGTLRRRFVSVLVGGFRARPRQGIPCGPGPRTSAH